MLNKLLENNLDEKYLTSGLFVDKLKDLWLDVDFYIWFSYDDFFNVKYQKDKCIYNIKYENY